MAVPIHVINRSSNHKKKNKKNKLSKL